MYGGRNFSALAFLFMLGWFNQKNAGYIKGGSYPAGPTDGGEVHPVGREDLLQ